MIRVTIPNCVGESIQQQRRRFHHSHSNLLRAPRNVEPVLDSTRNSDDPFYDFVIHYTHQLTVTFNFLYVVIEADKHCDYSDGLANRHHFSLSDDFQASVC